MALEIKIISNRVRLINYVIRGQNSDYNAQCRRFHNTVFELNTYTSSAIYVPHLSSEEPPMNFKYADRHWMLNNQLVNFHPEYSCMDFFN